MLIYIMLLMGLQDVVSIECDAFSIAAYRATTPVNWSP